MQFYGLNNGHQGFDKYMILRGIYSDSKSDADPLILKITSLIHCTLNQRSLCFQNVTKYTVFTT